MQIKDIIDKLSSYNLFNYLFPGFLFVIILNYTTTYSEVLPESITVLEQIVLIYFSGLVLSRIGSLIIESILLKLSLIKPLNSSDYLEKSKDNHKLEIIFEAMNMYRTLASMSLVLSTLTFIKYFSHTELSSQTLIIILMELLLFALFSFAFCKQRRKVLESILSLI